MWLFLGFILVLFCIGSVEDKVNKVDSKLSKQCSCKCKKK